MTVRRFTHPDMEPPTAEMIDQYIAYYMNFDRLHRAVERCRIEVTLREVARRKEKVRPSNIVAFASEFTY
jgi:hypothetical protein